MGGAGDVRGRRAGSTCRGVAAARARRAQDRSGDRDAGTPVVRAGKGVKDRLSRLVAALLDGAVAAYRRRVRRSAPPGHRRHGRLRRGAHGVLRSVGRALWTDAESVARDAAAAGLRTADSGAAARGVRHCLRGADRRCESAVWRHAT